MNDIAIKKIRLFDDLDNTFMDRILSKICPVGSLFWTSKSPEDDEGDPNNFMIGTWERVKDCFIYNADDNDTIDVSEGGKEVKLSTTNLPKHTHSLQSHTHTVSGDISTASGGVRIDDPLGQCPQYDIDSQSWYGRFGYTWAENISGAGSGCLYAYNNGYAPYWSINFNHPHGNDLHIEGSYDNSGDGGFANQSFSIMPPHLNRYCWRRIA